MSISFTLCAFAKALLIRGVQTAKHEIYDQNLLTGNVGLARLPYELIERFGTTSLHYLIR